MPKPQPAPPQDPVLPEEVPGQPEVERPLPQEPEPDDPPEE